MRRLAAAALWLAACGDDGATADAPPAPVEGDVMVTTTVRGGAFVPGTPVGGVTIVVRQPDGRIGETATSDTEGNATVHRVLAGATVTAVYPPAQSLKKVTSFLGVQPGDHLTFGDGYFIGGSNANPLIEVEFEPFPGARLYWFKTSCGETRGDPLQSPLIMRLFGCDTATGPLAMLVNGPEGYLAASRYVPQISYADGTVIGSAPWIENPEGNFTVAIEGLDQLVVTDLAAIFTYGPQIDVPQRPVHGIVVNSTSASAAITIPDSTLRVVGHATVERSVGGVPDSRVAVAHVYRAFASDATAVELSAPTLPWVGGLFYSSDVREAVWLQSAGPYDGAVVDVSWFPGGSQNFDTIHWTAILPPGQTELDLAQLPTSLADELPTPINPPSVSVTLIDYEGVDGYDALRALPEGQLATFGNSEDPLPLMSGDRTAVQVTTVSL